MKDLIIKGYETEEKKKRRCINRAMKQMRERNVFTPDTVRNYLINQIDNTFDKNPDTYGGLTLTYTEALNYYDEIIK